MGKASDARPMPTIVMLGGKNYKLTFSFNAFCALEEQFGSVDKAMDGLASGSLAAYRALLWAGLLDAHGDEFPTPKHVGALMNVAEAEEYARSIAKALESALPAASGEETEKN